MAAVTTKSTSILNLDALPVISNTTGEAAAGVRRVVTDSMVGNIGDSIGSIYRLVRLPSNAKIKPCGPRSRCRPAPVPPKSTSPTATTRTSAKMNILTLVSHDKTPLWNKMMSAVVFDGILIVPGAPPWKFFCHAPG